MKDDAYSLTANTRNKSSDTAKNLASDGVRIIEADLDDIASLQVAFAGTSIIFAAANFFEPFIKCGGEEAIDIETRQRAIIKQPNKTLGGKFVNGVTDIMTAGEMLATWASVRGVETEYVQIDKATYHSLWPQWGKVMDKMHEYLEWAKDHSFSSEDVILSKEDLGITGLSDTRTAFATMN